MTDSKKVFISYCKDDIETAKRLYDDLKKEDGIEPWIDEEDIHAGQKEKDIIIRKIKESSYFLALLSSNSVSTKGSAQKELKLALDILHEYPDAAADIFVIPIYLDECKVKIDEIESRRAVKLYESYDDGFQKILKAILQERYDRENNMIGRDSVKWITAIAICCILAFIAMFYAFNQNQNIAKLENQITLLNTKINEPSKALNASTGEMNQLSNTVSKLETKQESFEKEIKRLEDEVKYVREIDKKYDQKYDKIMDSINKIQQNMISTSDKIVENYYAAMKKNGKFFRVDEKGKSDQ